MIRRILAFLAGPKRQPGQACLSCCHFIDHTDSENGDELGYCGELVDRLGLEEALKVDPYGGRWVDSRYWCKRYEGGPTLWPMEDESLE